MYLYIYQYAATLCAWDATGSADEYNGDYTYGGTQLGKSYWQKDAQSPCGTYHYIMYVSTGANKEYWVFGSADTPSSEYADGQIHCSDQTQPDNPMECTEWKDSMTGQATSYSISITDSSCPVWPCDRVVLSNTETADCDHEFVKHDTIDNAYVYNGGTMYFYFNALQFKAYCSSRFGYNDCSDNPIRDATVSSHTEEWFDLQWDQSTAWSLGGQTSASVLCLGPTTSPTNVPTSSPVTPSPVMPTPITPAPITPSPVTPSPFTLPSTDAPTASPITTTRTPSVQPVSSPTMTTTRTPNQTVPNSDSLPPTPMLTQTELTPTETLETTKSADTPTLSTQEDTDEDTDDNDQSDQPQDQLQQRLSNALGISDMMLYIAVGGIILLIIALCVVACCCYKRSKTTPGKTAQKVHSMEMSASIEMQTPPSSDTPRVSALVTKKRRKRSKQRSSSKLGSYFRRRSREEGVLRKSVAAREDIRKQLSAASNVTAGGDSDILDDILSPPAPVLPQQVSLQLMGHNAVAARGLAVVAEDDSDADNDDLWKAGSAGTQTKTLGSDETAGAEQDTHSHGDHDSQNERTAAKSIHGDVVNTAGHGAEKSGEDDVYFSKRSLFSALSSSEKEGDAENDGSSLMLQMVIDTKQGRNSPVAVLEEEVEYGVDED